MNKVELVKAIRENGIQPGYVQNLIELHLPERERMVEMYERYKSSREVLQVFKYDPVKQYEDFETGGNVRRIDQYVNNKLNNPFDFEIPESRTGYMHGIPISYKTDNEVVRDAINRFNRLNNSDDKNAELGKMATICGYASRLIYVDKNGETKIKNLKPFNTVFVGDDMTEPEYALYYYPVRDSKTDQLTYYAEFYDEDYYYVFEGDIEALRLVGRYDHLAVDVPLFGVPNNDELMGDAERVKSLIDHYDRTLSDASSEISQTRLAYLILRGLGLDEEEIQNVKKSGAFELFDKEQDVSYLTKDVNDTMIENHLNRLEKNIMRFSQSVNFNSEEFSGNVPVIGMQLKLMALENKCMKFERKFSAFLRYQFKVLLGMWKYKREVITDDDDYLDIDFVFTRNIPVNKLEEAQVLATLNGQVSDETRYANSSLIPDPAIEIERKETGLLPEG